mmetsp:Transcript_7791/g.17868  ORF Transcript_7791/g.17868 Transcript_7791/m.17868 type:complete len:264 (-) Transcript_7791:52-843(-)
MWAYSVARRARGSARLSSPGRASGFPRLRDGGVAQAQASQEGLAATSGCAVGLQRQHLLLAVLRCLAALGARGARGRCDEAAEETPCRLAVASWGSTADAEGRHRSTASGNKALEVRQADACGSTLPCRHLEAKLQLLALGAAKHNRQGSRKFDEAQSPVLVSIENPKEAVWHKAVVGEAQDAQGLPELLRQQVATGCHAPEALVESSHLLRLQPRALHELLEVSWRDVPREGLQSAACDASRTGCHRPPRPQCRARGLRGGG